jgi:hypothetical protein
MTQSPKIGNYFLVSFVSSFMGTSGKNPVRPIASDAFLVVTRFGGDFASDAFLVVTPFGGDFLPSNGLSTSNIGS